ncbi:MAG: TetR/AcrR family transcriptional regulator [Phycisphaerales bacterium]|nr:TetR/AcrR family transcriptional regulator [Phycisphaerales bacterium]
MSASRIGKKITRKEQAKKTRTAILNAAADEFSKNGYHGTRIETLAKHVGISMSSIYVHFKDKAAVFEAVMSQAANLFTEKLNIRIDQHSCPKTRDLIVINSAISFAESYPSMFRIIMNTGKAEKSGRTIVAEMIEKTRRVQYPKGKVDGVFWPHLHETVTAVFETGVVFVVLDWWLDNPSKASRNDILKTLVNVRRYGVEIPNDSGHDFLTDDDIMSFNRERAIVD